METAINKATSAIHEVKQTGLELESLNSLNQYLVFWDTEYAESLKNIFMFNPTLTSLWSIEQRKYFVKLLYHARGHFHDVLWYMGCFAPDKRTKKCYLREYRR